MRHRKKGRKLNRTASHKKAMLRNLANQLFEHKEIRTTTAKAKEARPTVERLITYAKKGDLHHRRLAFSFLREKATIKMLFEEIAPTFDDRQGGYTRVIKLGRRLGDGAPMSILQLVGFETLGDTVKKETKKKTKKQTEKSEEEVNVADDKVEAAPAPVVAKVSEDTVQPETVQSEVKDIQESEIAGEKKSAPEEILKEDTPATSEKAADADDKPAEEIKSEKSEDSESEKKK